MGALEGEVADENGAPIPGITVLLKGHNKGAVTDARGNFSITNIAPATYTIEISGVGFEKHKFEIVIESGKNIWRSVRLKESTTEMDEVVVVAESEAQTLELSAKAVDVIETREVKLKSADLGAVIAQAEGVNVQRAGGLGSNTRFSLNGLSGDQIRFFYDDIPLNYTPYAFGIANVPVNMIDRVEIYKGVVPIQFGADALGGAVNLVSPEIYDGFGGSASYQVGSFGTHRVTANVNYADDNTGLLIVAGGFYDHTDNDYEVDVEVPDERGRLQAVTVPRFHDGYEAFGANLKVGIRNKKWANELSAEVYYGDYKREIQHNQVMSGNPFGEVQFNSFSEGVGIRYNINPSDKLELDIKAGYNYNERISIDTSRCLYNWFGECVRVNINPGEFQEPDHLMTISESAFLRQQLNYTLARNHSLKLSIAPTYALRTGDDLLVDSAFDPALGNGYLFDLVTGLEYTIELLDKRLQNIAFVKSYRQSIRIESIDPNVEGTLVDKRSVSNFGAGNGLKYTWSPRFSTKLSYEYAIRLPRQDEIFGDGLLIGENLALGPETSHNFNLQWNYKSKEKTRADWNIQGNFFLRQIDDLIFLFVGVNDAGSYDNVWSATSKGLEFSGKWKDFIKGLTISANTTYQQYINTSDSGPFESFRNDRIPNTPFFFANSAVAYQLQDILKKSDRLSFFWNSRYVHEYFRSWESAGLQEFKLEIPNQMIHTAGLTHRMNIKKLQNALTLEVQNLANAKVFDFFGVQRPGRAFFLKMTLQF